MTLYKPSDEGLPEDCLSCQRSSSCKSFIQKRDKHYLAQFKVVMSAKLIKLAHQCKVCHHLKEKSNYIGYCCGVQRIEVYVYNPPRFNKLAAEPGQVSFL